MVTITDKERKVLRAILTNQFNDPDYHDAEIWAYCINDANEPSDIEGKALSGVVASLSKKGLVRSSHEGEDATVSLTAEGITAAS